MIEYVLYDEILTDYLPDEKACVLRISISMPVSDLVCARKPFVARFGNDGLFGTDAGYVAFTYLASVKGKAIYQAGRLYQPETQDQLPYPLANLAQLEPSEAVK
ncbi:hypothetical protein [Brucella inopinata]|uniref:hypothetical protein n=1 Tax=Brucella inopinata TaxID=1218315 RepID=UPI000A9B9DA3|nr:hypothetical protein [Brucella inopinata]